MIFHRFMKSRWPRVVLLQVVCGTLLTLSLCPVVLRAETAKTVTPNPLPKPAARFSTEPQQPPPVIAKSVDQFFTLLKQDQVNQAFDGILAGTKVKDRQNEVADLKSKTTGLLLEFGKVIDYELFESRQVGSRLMVLTYLSYSENFPVRWKLIYYKPADAWRLIDIRADTQVYQMLE